MLTSSEIFQKDFRNLGFEYFQTKRMGRLCFNSEWHDGILQKWPGTLPNRASYYNYFPYMDIYPFVFRREKTLRIMGGYCKTLNFDWIFPLRKIEAWNTTLFTPNEIETVLVRIYGKDWRTPIKSSHGVPSDQTCSQNWNDAYEYYLNI
jgi:hypothetical protein